MPLPASNSLNSLIINSDGTRAERSILFFCGMYQNFTTPTQNWRSRLHQSSAERMETWCIAIIRYQLVSLKFHCSRTHRLILRVHTKRYASAHTRTRKGKHENNTDTVLHLLQTPISPSPFYLPVSLMRSRLPCRDCTRQTPEQVFPPQEMQSKWESNMTALPHNQTPHPHLHTSTSVWEAFHSLLHACKIYCTTSCHPQLYKSNISGRMSFCPLQDFTCNCSK